MLTTEELIKDLQRYGNLQPSEKFAYVTIHPLADETEMLERLNIKPEQCFLCDSWWVIDEFMPLVEIFNHGTWLGVKYGQRSSGVQGHRFLISTRKTPIASDDVETVLRYLSDWVEENASLMSKRLRKYRILTSDDILL
jgi:hypothetical protein